MQTQDYEQLSHLTNRNNTLLLVIKLLTCYPKTRLGVILIPAKFQLVFAITY